MSVTAEKIAEVLALPVADRAFIAHQLIASLDDNVDTDAETQWQEVIDRRSREIDEAKWVADPWKRPSGTSAPSSMRAVSHPEAD